MSRLGRQCRVSGPANFDILEQYIWATAATLSISRRNGAAQPRRSTVANNNIDGTAESVSGTGGIAARAGQFQMSDGSFLTTPTLTIAATGNTIHNVFGYGIRINDADGSPTVNATITGNTVSGVGVTGEEGIQVEQLPLGDKLDRQSCDQRQYDDVGTAWNISWHRTARADRQYVQYPGTDAEPGHGTQTAAYVARHRIRTA